jgi:hypothetical protein
MARRFERRAGGNCVPVDKGSHRGPTMKRRT